jgi:hypothetical protein
MALYSMGYRFWVIQQGYAQWVSLEFSGYEPIIDKVALSALFWVVLGQSILLWTYMRKQSQKFRLAQGQLSSRISAWLKIWLISGAVLYLPVALAAKYYVQMESAAGKSQALEMSAYIYQLPYVGVGFVVMLIFLWRYGNWRHGLRFVPLLLALVILYTLYGGGDRFKLIGALTGSAVILGAAVRPSVRLLWLAPLLVLAIILFSIGGASRDQLKGGELRHAAWERFRNAHDANFLDGFVYSMQGAERFGYHYGEAHLEILYRPIPRAIWPGKPIGNYQVRAMGVNLVKEIGTIGISPSLFGTFYEEAGGFGVVLLSFLYGGGMAYLTRKIRRLNPALAAIVRGSLCGWLVSLFRGGDIAGIVAWAFMSYWPIGLFIYIWRRDIVAGTDWIPVSFRRRRRLKRKAVRNHGSLAPASPSHPQEMDPS